MLDLKSLDDLVAKPQESAENWALILKLMRNHWFSRRWVIQELALAQEATVRWGSMDLSWTDFADAIALFMTKYEQIKQSSLDWASPAFNDFKATDARALGANVIVHATVNLFRKSHEGRIKQRLLPLEILVSSLLLAFEATEPRDTIFAVLMLANDCGHSASNPDITPDPRITPDYSKCLLDVYADFMDYCIQQSQSLDIFCRYWAAVQKPAKFEALERGKSTAESMPSWIPLIKQSAFGEPRNIVQGRANGDSFVGGPERKGQQVYNAAAGLPAWHEFGRRDLKHGKLSKGFTFPLNRHSRTSSSNRYSRPAPLATHKSDPNTLAENSAAQKETSLRTPKYNGTLYLRGFCLDIISNASGRVAGDGIIPSDAFLMAGWDHEDNPETVPDRLWRTLVADRGPDGKSPPPWYARTCLECLQHQDREGDLDIPKLMESSTTPSTQLTFLKRVQPIVFKRRFFETKGAKRTEFAENKNGNIISRPGDKLRSQTPLFGLGSAATKKGDLICILFGCSVPVVLRKDRNGSHYQFIGECYVHGTMNGEAIADRAPAWPYEHLMYTTFELR